MAQPAPGSDWRMRLVGLDHLSNSELMSLIKSTLLPFLAGCVHNAKHTQSLERFSYVLCHWGPELNRNSFAWAVAAMVISELHLAYAWDVSVSAYTKPLVLVTLARLLPSPPPLPVRHRAGDGA